MGRRSSFPVKSDLFEGTAFVHLVVCDNCGKQHANTLARDNEIPDGWWQFELATNKPNGIVRTPIPVRYNMAATIHACCDACLTELLPKVIAKADRKPLTGAF